MKEIYKTVFDRAIRATIHEAHQWADADDHHMVKMCHTDAGEITVIRDYLLEGNLEDGARKFHELDTLVRDTISSACAKDEEYDAIDDAFKIVIRREA